MKTSKLLAKIISEGFHPSRTEMLDALMAHLPPHTFSPTQDHHGKPWIHHLVSEHPKLIDNESLPWLVKHFGPDFLTCRDGDGHNLLEILFPRILHQIEERKSKSYIRVDSKTLVAILEHAPTSLLAHPQDDSPGQYWLHRMLQVNWNSSHHNYDDEPVIETLLQHAIDLSSPWKSEGPLILQLKTTSQIQKAIEHGLDLDLRGFNPMDPEMPLARILTQRFPQLVLDDNPTTSTASSGTLKAYFKEIQSAKNKHSCAYALQKEANWAELENEHHVPAIWCTLHSTPALASEWLKPACKKEQTALAQRDSRGRLPHYHLSSIWEHQHFIPYRHKILKLLPTFQLSDQGDGIYAQLWAEHPIHLHTSPKGNLGKLLNIMPDDVELKWGTPAGQYRLAQRLVQTLAYACLMRAPGKTQFSYNIEEWAKLIELEQRDMDKLTSPLRGAFWLIAMTHHSSQPNFPAYVYGLEKNKTFPGSLDGGDYRQIVHGLTQHLTQNLQQGSGSSSEKHLAYFRKHLLDFTASAATGLPTSASAAPPLPSRRRFRS